MPGLQAQLQQGKENAVRSGTSTGDLGTSFQGDIYGAMQKNLANAMNLYGQQLGANQNMFSQNQDNANQWLNQENQNYIAGKNWSNNQQQQLFGGLGSLIGSHWGPAGAQAGNQIGSAAASIW